MQKSREAGKAKSREAGKAGKSREVRKAEKQKIRTRNWQEPKKKPAAKKIVINDKYIGSPINFVDASSDLQS